MTAGGAVINVKNRKVHFKDWDVTLNCEILEVKPSKVSPRFKKRKMNSQCQNPMKSPHTEDQPSHGYDGKHEQGKSKLWCVSDATNVNSHDGMNDVSELEEKSEEKNLIGLPK